MILGSKKIEVNIDGIIRIRSRIIRQCDHCGKKELVNTKYYKDYCKKCSYIYRKHGQKIGKDSPYWKGGMALNDNGYYRFTCGKNESKYIHKIVYGNHIGRSLSRQEQVHHIDFNKSNNEISNLFLCENITKHHKIHFLAENLGCKLIEKYIWYNFDTNEYVLEKFTREKVKFTPSKTLSCKYKDHNGKIYALAYLGHKKHQGYHRFVYEEFTGTKLTKDYHVHHIDGDTLNNDINNLVKLSRSEHKIAHNSLQFRVADLYKQSIVKFENGKYLLGI